MSARPRILVTRRLPDAVGARLGERYDVVLNQEDTALARDSLVEALGTFDALVPTITDRFDADMLRGARVRVLANYGAGVDHIDLAAAREAGIVVTNTPDVLTEATAELAILLMLMAARRAGEGERQLRGGDWPGWHPTHMIGQSIAGRTLGLVGFGRIAQATARMAREGFGMRIAYHSRHRASPSVEARYEARHVASLHDLAAEADVLSLHTPGGEATRHLVDAALLARMKRNAILVNTARGTVVDEAALAEALATGALAAAGLDVYEREPLVDERLTKLENAVLLPHLGSATIEARVAMGMRAADNLDAFFDGSVPGDQVN